MPYFYSEAELDIDVDEFVDSCSNLEIKELILKLKKRGYLDSSNGIVTDTEDRNLGQIFYDQALSKLQNSYYQLSNEDIETIAAIAKKY
jgi:hypothetical protein